MLTLESAETAQRVTAFWALVSVGDPHECWPWTGYTEDGYGLFYLQGKMRGAHELALTFTTGERRHDSMDTCHSCHNPICCNPAHLRFDTRAGNVADMVSARRGRRGRFTDAEVEAMRIRYSLGARQTDLAEQYGVTNGLVSQIVRGLRYRNAPGPITENRERYNRGQ